MHEIYRFLTTSPLLALFITIGLGYFIGKLKIKTFVLGGIAGSLIMGVLIGQLDIKIPEGIGTIFFALFIYSVGYQGGPQFFRSLNRETGIQLLSATITCVLGLLCVLVAAWVYHLDRGTAAGLAAGGLTQSAIIGTANDAIAKLGLSHEAISTMQANVAVGYAVCYIFGSFGPILMLSAIIPGIMRWDLREEAKKLAKTLSGAQKPALEPGQFEAVADIATRIYQIEATSTLIGRTTSSIFDEPEHMVIEGIIRGDQPVTVTPETVLEVNDIVAVTTKINNFVKPHALFAKEVGKPEMLSLTEETRNLILTSTEFDGKTVEECYTNSTDENHYGLIVSHVSRLGEQLTAEKDLVLKRGDEVTFVGRAVDLDRISAKFGRIVSAAKVTDFVMFGLGMSLGILLGMQSVKIAGVSISLGTGGGCLLAGLVFGLIQSIPMMTQNAMSRL